MLELSDFDASDYEHYPCVENFGGEIVPRRAQVSMRTKDYAGLPATVVVDGNGIQVLIYGEDGKQKMVFCLELNPFPLAVFVAGHLDEPLDPEVLTRLGFERFK